MSVSRRYVTCLVLVLFLLGAGCQRKTDDQASALIFSAMMEVNGAQEFHVSFGVQNAGQNRVHKHQEPVGSHQTSGNVIAEMFARRDE